jgi:hypothetical protein
MHSLNKGLIFLQNLLYFSLIQDRLPWSFQYDVTSRLFWRVSANTPLWCALIQVALREQPGALFKQALKAHFNSVSMYVRWGSEAWNTCRSLFLNPQKHSLFRKIKISLKSTSFCKTISFRLIEGERSERYIVTCLMADPPVLTLWSRKRERDRKDRWRIDAKRKSRGEVRETFFPRGRKTITLLEGSQTTPARPSGTNKVKVKTLW